MEPVAGDDGGMDPARTDLAQLPERGQDLPPRLSQPIPASASGPSSCSSRLRSSESADQPLLGPVVQVRSSRCRSFCPAATIRDRDHSQLLGSRPPHVQAPVHDGGFTAADGVEQLGSSRGAQDRGLAPPRARLSGRSSSSPSVALDWQLGQPYVEVGPARELREP